MLASRSSGPGSMSASDGETKMSGLCHDKSHEAAKSVVRILVDDQPMA
ncbi:hypothetical protein OHB26_34540 [Nocardia sp. NBC_01503]|nr:hypothetical protein [Nocardia sp. NBC_01503]WTL31963.1 hypothetical protein OHB26_34540 [Nocardia sp. NBC_01503]